MSESANRVFVKLVGIPGQPEPGLFVLDRDNGAQAFIGNDDYGRLVVNEATGRLFTDIESDAHLDRYRHPGRVGRARPAGGRFASHPARQRSTHLSQE